MSSKYEFNGQAVVPMFPQKLKRQVYIRRSSLRNIMLGYVISGGLLVTLVILGALLFVFSMFTTIFFASLAVSTFFAFCVLPWVQPEVVGVFGQTLLFTQVSLTILGVFLTTFCAHVALQTFKASDLDFLLVDLDKFIYYETRLHGRLGIHSTRPQRGSILPFDGAEDDNFYRLQDIEQAAEDEAQRRVLAAK